MAGASCSGKRTSWSDWAINVGFSFAPIIGGALATRAFSWIFAVNAASAGLYFLLVWFGLPETRPPTEGRRRLINPLSALRDRRLLALSVLATLLTSQFYQAYSTLPLVMDSLGLTESAYGYANAANGVTVVGFSILLSRTLQRWQPRTGLVAASLLVGIGFALNQFADRLEHFTIAIVIWSPSAFRQNCRIALPATPWRRCRR